VAGDDLRERGLAGAVGAHNGVDFAGLDLEGDALEDLFVAGAGVEVRDLKHCSCQKV